MRYEVAFARSGLKFQSFNRHCRGAFVRKFETLDQLARFIVNANRLSGTSKDIFFSWNLSIVEIKPNLTKSEIHAFNRKVQALRKKQT